MRLISWCLGVVVLALGWLAPAAPAQCPLEWSSGGPQPELSGIGGCSTLWDPDGAGPLTQRLVIGGRALLGGAHGIDQRVMTWDGSKWLPLGNLGGPDVSTSVAALIAWNGLLVAGGNFTGGGIDRIALWSGSQWQPLGTGFPVTARALTVWNGNLVAAGYDAAGSVDTPYIRVWNGVTWSSLPTPPMLHTPLALASYQGHLCVGGHRTAPAQGVFERWTGTSWATSITASSRITCLAVRFTNIIGGTDTLYAGGWFNSIGGASGSHIAATSGGTAFTWSAVGSLTTNCHDVHVRNTGAITIALVAMIGNPAMPVVQWSGGSWVAMGAPMGGAAYGLTSLDYYAGSYHVTNAESATSPASVSTARPGCQFANPASTGKCAPPPGWATT